MNNTLRILSYNIHKGFNSTNSRYLLEEIRHAIRSSNADILFLQEVVGENTKHQEKYNNWPKSSQFEFLADQIWPHHAYGKNALYSHGHHGNAILSKFPFTQWKNHDISHWNFSQRGVLYGITINQLHVYCVHLGLFAKEQNIQLEKIIALIKKNTPLDAPLIIAGDFNDWNKTIDKKLEEQLHVKDSHKTLHGKLAKTFPAALPLLTMDRIYIRGFDVSKAHTLNNKKWKSLSDHKCLFSELTFKQEP